MKPMKRLFAKFVKKNSRKIKMHRKIIVLLLSTISMSSCAPTSQKEGLVIKITREYEKMERNKHGLLLVGSGSAIPDKVHGFILHFFGNQKLELSETRKLVINLVEDLLQMVNENTQIQDFLADKPFTAKNYDLRINFFEPCEQLVESPYVAYVSLIDGIIYYNYHDNLNDRYDSKMTKSETYEEAKRIVPQ